MCWVHLGWCYHFLSDEEMTLDINSNSFATPQTVELPSGKRLHNYGKSPFWMGKSTISTISMAIFNSFLMFLYVYQRVRCFLCGSRVRICSRWTPDESKGLEPWFVFPVPTCWFLFGDSTIVYHTRIYPLVMTSIAIDNGHWNSGLFH